MARPGARWAAVALALLLVGLHAGAGAEVLASHGQHGSAHVPVTAAAPVGDPTAAPARADMLRSSAERLPLLAAALVALFLLAGSRRRAGCFPPGRPGAATHRRVWRPRRAPPLTA